MAKDVIISLKNVSKDYYLYNNEKEKIISLFWPEKVRKHSVLKDISLEVRRGDSVGIIGRNGAGKSTLLKIITGVTFPTRGEVFVKGRIGALLELTAGFHVEMTGRENIHLKAAILGIKDEELMKFEYDVMKFADIGEYINQPIKTYSSGMKLRLGFAMNVCIVPDVLIIDEALGVGDKYFRKKCYDFIQQLIEKGVAILFVGHDEKVVNKICKRFYTISNGRLSERRL